MRRLLPLFPASEVSLAFKTALQDLHPNSRNLENTRMLKCVDVRSDNGLALKHYILLVIIAVAERHATDGDAGQGIHNIADSDIGPDTTHVDHSVHGQGLTTVVDAVDARGAGGVCILPYAEAVVDEGVVHPEDGVAWAC
jgi:hypothetical protein